MSPLCVENRTKYFLKSATWDGDMAERRHSDSDRRSGKDRRRGLNLDYFLNQRVERRKMKERRSELGRGENWLRQGQSFHRPLERDKEGIS